MIKFLFSSLIVSLSLYAQNPSLDEMISQMIVIGFDGSKEGDKWVDQIAKDIKREKIGGVILNEKNIQNPAQLKKLTEYLKKQSNPSSPLFILAEQEGGDNSLLSPKKGFGTFPSAFEMAKSQDITEAEETYKTMSREIAECGINVNLAPILDLQPRENVYSVSKLQRSYSSYEEIVTAYATLFIDALNEKNILSVVKYFPTAGANLWDNFSTEVDITGTWHFEQLKPYYDLIAFKKVDAIVISHAMHKELDAKNPLLFSKNVIQGLLRDKMHFEGVVFADNLRTTSLPSSIDFKQRVIRSLQAGSDVLVFSNYFSDNASTPFTVQKIILDAIKSGELKEKNIEMSYKRIMLMKQKLSKRGSNVN